MTCASCSCQLNVIESMGDYGVVSYLADADGNVTVGPTTSVPMHHSTTPSTRSVSTPPSPAAPTLTSTPANTNPQNKSKTSPTTEKQTPSTPTAPAQIPESQTSGSQILSVTSDTPTPNTSTPQPSTPTAGEKPTHKSMDDEQTTAMLKGEKSRKITQS